MAMWDEQKNLPQCLEWRSFVNQVLVLESAFDAAAREVIESLGRHYEVYLRRGDRSRGQAHMGVGRARSRRRGADRRCRRGDLSSASKAVEVGTAGRGAGYYLPFRLSFMGSWVRPCGWYPAFQPRLFRAGLRAEQAPQDGWEWTGDAVVHERVVVEGSTGCLECEVLHYDFKGITNWGTRHNRYSTWEAMRWMSKTDQRAPTSARILRLLLPTR